MAIVSLLFIQSCKKNQTDLPLNIPSITTKLVDSSETTAIVAGDITSNGGTSVAISGVCWSTNENPTINDNKTTDGILDIGYFESKIEGLTSSTKYYVRAYATNIEGTGYGETVSFTTKGLAKLTTADISELTAATAVSGGNITSDGGFEITARGVCWSTSNNPTIGNEKTNDSIGAGMFSSKIINLTENVLYYARAYATNSSGTSYGNTISFTTTSATKPILTTSAISGITQTSAISGGTISSDGGAAITARGVCWSISQNPTISDSKTTDGDGNGTFTSNINSISILTKYYVRAYATNKAGTSYGNEITFTTSPPNVPTLTTKVATNITQSTAGSGGNITDDGGSAITMRGVCWSLIPDPTTSDNKTTNGGGTGLFTSNLSNLIEGLTYYVRAYATNSAGTAYGNEIEFTTLEVGLPILTTTAISGTGATSRTSGGVISSDGGAPITDRGIVWGKSQNPTIFINDNITSDGVGIGTFSSTITNLTGTYTYYVRAYATNSAGTSYGNQISLSIPLAVGQSYQGGKIAYLFQSGDVGYDANVPHGLIAATADGPTIRWNNGTNITTNATSTTIGTGNVNTTAIINAQGTSVQYAARVARATLDGAYTDWYLPNQGELSKLYLNRTAIGGFANNIYWSSTEASLTNAVYMDFNNGTLLSFSKSTATIRIRAIRKF
jgi:hypothetical protein